MRLIELVLSWVTCKLSHGADYEPPLEPGYVYDEIGRWQPVWFRPSSYCYWCGKPVGSHWRFSRFIT